MVEIPGTGRYHPYSSFLSMWKMECIRIRVWDLKIDLQIATSMRDSCNKSLFLCGLAEYKFTLRTN